MQVTQTNLGKTNIEIIYELLLSLNNGNCSYRGGTKVNEAIQEYKELIKYGIIELINEKEV